MRLLASLLLAASAFAETTPVVTDAKWLATGKLEEGWMERNHEDEDWDSATVIEGPAGSGEHYTIANLFAVESGAKWIWSGRGREIWVRRTVQAPQGFRRAEMIYIADDAVELYVNGRAVDLYNTATGGWGMRGCGVVLDLVPWMEDGENVIAAHVINKGGSCGFAADIRVDGEPLVAPISEGKELTAEVKAEVRRHAAKLDDDDALVREDATAALERLARENGKRVADEAAAAWTNPSPEVNGRIARVRDSSIVDLEPTVDGDPRFAFGMLDLEGFGRFFAADDSIQRNGFRSTVWLRVMLEREPAAMTALLRKAAQDGSEASAERAARLIGALGYAKEAGTLVEILRSRAPKRSGAFAAAALARVGGKEHLEVLREAAKCGAPDTERAAKRALQILGK